MDNIEVWCGAIITISGAVAAIWKWVVPVLRIQRRVENLEQARADDHEKIMMNAETNKLLCKGMFCLLDIAGEQLGTGSPESLKRILSVKKDIQEHLLNGMVQK